ncbi:MAG: hypothetical protein WCG27_05635 [Pseudomonadota bacterium]
MGIINEVKEMSTKRKIHVGIGVFFLVNGIYGVYDEYISVIDFLKGASPLIFLAIGGVALVAGITKVTR